VLRAGGTGFTEDDQIWYISRLPRTAWCSATAKTGEYDPGAGRRTERLNQTVSQIGVSWRRNVPLMS
jgi:hypothetical protein